MSTVRLILCYVWLRILIATQYTTPIDGSHYVVGYYGPSVESIRADNLTYVVKRPDWYS